MDVAYRGMVYSIKTVLPWMQAAGKGHIVNIASSAGRVLVLGLSAAYASCKAAIDAYTQILQEELKGTSIHVLLVRPAIVGGTQFFAKHVPPASMPRMADFVPYLTPPEVADGVLRALRKRQRILDIPGFLPLFYLAFDLTPGLLRWLMSLGGGAHTDFGKSTWKYKK
jgi:NADP-dependent 3-hydroxy acid dehydrogenase YdfG